jgi:hypothetical protein
VNSEISINLLFLLFLPPSLTFSPEEPRGLAGDLLGRHAEGWQLVGCREGVEEDWREGGSEGGRAMRTID